ncbi:hypothetical protein FBU31_006316, partial [Coemansia sp. 'formosensis']
AYYVVSERLGFKRHLDHLVPHVLTPKQIESRLEFAHWFSDKYANMDGRTTFNLMTGDETWIPIHTP